MPRERVMHLITIIVTCFTFASCVQPDFFGKKKNAISIFLTDVSSRIAALNPITNIPVMGEFESINTQFVATGWCADPNDPSASLEYAGYVDGTTITGQLAFQGNTSTNRPLINTVNELTGNHGFSASIPSTFIGGTVHSLSIYCRDLNTNEWLLISNSPLTFGTTGNVITEIRVKNPSQNSRLSSVTTMVTFNKGTYTNESILAQGFTLDGKIASAVPMEHFWENGSVTNKVAIAKFISHPIAFSGNEQKVLELRAEGASNIIFQPTPKAVELHNQLHNEFYIEVEALDGSIYRATAGINSGQNFRVIEESGNHMVLEFRTRFINISNGNLLPGLLAGFYFTTFSHQETVEVKVQISNGHILEPISGGVEYRKLSVSYRASEDTQFDLKKQIYGATNAQNLPNGWKSYCIDGCINRKFQIGTPQAPQTITMNRGRIGDGQTYLLSGVLTNLASSSIQNTLIGTTHLAEGHHRLYGLQRYNFLEQTGKALSSLNYFPERRFNETRAQELRNADNYLCDIPTQGGHIGNLFEFAPVNPGGTGFQPQFNTNRIPNTGWEIAYKESNCQLYDFLAKYEVGESIRPQFYFEESDGMMLPMTASNLDPKNEINWWASKFFNGNGQIVNSQFPHLSARSGSFNNGTRRLQEVCWGGECAFLEHINSPTGRDNQHYEVGFAMMAHLFTGHPMYRQYLDTMLVSVYLEYFNDWAMGQSGGPWNRIDAERAIGRTTLSALSLMRAVDNSTVVPLLLQKIPQKIATLIPFATENQSQFGMSAIAPEPAGNVWSIGYCANGLHAVPNALALQDCSWYVNNNAFYTPHWQWGLKANALAHMMLMGIGREEALALTKLYFDSLPMLHNMTTGEPMAINLFQDPNDNFSGGYHTWWMAPTLLAMNIATLYDPTLENHPSWQHMPLIRAWYEGNSTPLMQNIPHDFFMDGFRIPLTMPY